jgi:hypothetical protein
MRPALASELDTFDSQLRARKPGKQPAVAWRSTRKLPVFVASSLDDYISPSDWMVYSRAMQIARERDVLFAIGGGLAVSLYTGQWRPSRDIDLYVLPDQHQALIDGLLDAGLRDLYEDKPYDRNWIFRAVHDDVIVDVIWGTANQTGQVERRWLTGGARAELHGVELQLLPPEEVLQSKLHVMQRDRCDWPDLLNLLYTQGPQLHWSRLLTMFAGDERLLTSLLALFTWVAPARAQQLPPWLWSKLELPNPERLEPILRDDSRIRQLDSRPWFTEVDV